MLQLVHEDFFRDELAVNWKYLRPFRKSSRQFQCLESSSLVPTLMRWSSFMLAGSDYSSSSVISPTKTFIKHAYNGKLILLNTHLVSSGSAGIGIVIRRTDIASTSGCCDTDDRLQLLVWLMTVLLGSLPPEMLVLPMLLELLTTFDTAVDWFAAVNKFEVSQKKSQNLVLQLVCTSQIKKLHFRCQEAREIKSIVAIGSDFLINL